MRIPPQPLTVTVSPRKTTSGRRSGPSCLCVSLRIPGGPHVPLVHRFPFPLARPQAWSPSAEPCGAFCLQVGS